MRRLPIILGLVITVTVPMSGGLVQAREKPDVIGSWKETDRDPDTGQVDLFIIFKLKREGNKLSGSMIVGEIKVPIENGIVKDDQISFKMTHDSGPVKVIEKFSGKLTGDTIKGKREHIENGGYVVVHDWLVTRVRD